MKGQVVNVMSYGAFVKLEPGIEGLVHISEMSWTKCINHPNELVQIGDEIDVVILGVDKAGQQLSLGMKQAQENPWTKVADRYPVDTIVKGEVRNLTNYGAFIELEEGIDGLLQRHNVVDLKNSYPSESPVERRGSAVQGVVDRSRTPPHCLGSEAIERRSLGDDIPSKYQPGQVVHGKVTKITNFLGVHRLAGRPGRVAPYFRIGRPQGGKPLEDIVKVNDDIEVKILRVDVEERKIGLSAQASGMGRGRRRFNSRGSQCPRCQKDSEGKEGSQGELKGGLGKAPDRLIAPTAE